MTTIDNVLKSIEQVGTRLDKVEAEAAHASAGVTELAQKNTSMGVQGSTQIKTKSFAEKVKETIEQNMDMIRKSGSVTLDIKDAFGGTTTENAPVTVSGKIGAPEPYTIGMQFGVTTAARAAEAQHYIYSRWNENWAGDVAPVSELGTEAQWISPSHTKCQQDAISLSALSEISDIAAMAAPELERVIQLVMNKSLTIQTDKILALGNKVAKTGQFEGFLALAKTKKSTFKNLADALQDGAADMEILGLQPNVAFCSSRTWLEVSTLTNTLGDYLSGSYSQPMSLMLRNIPIRISNSVPDGKILLADNRFVELGLIQDATITLGMVNDQFARNARSLRINSQISPALYHSSALLLVEPTVAGSK
jgi:hypothetical protein